MRRNAPNPRSSLQRLSESHFVSGAVIGTVAVVVSGNGATTMGGGDGGGSSFGTSSQSVGYFLAAWRFTDPRGAVLQPANTANTHATIVAVLNTATLCGGTGAAQAVFRPAALGAKPKAQRQASIQLWNLAGRLRAEHL
jgi:hypothetical protein